MLGISLAALLGVFGFGISPAFGQSCPIGQMVQWSGQGEIEFKWSPQMNSKFRTCKVLNPQAFAAKPVKILGCSGSSYIVESPQFVTNDCFNFQKPNLTITSTNFTATKPGMADLSPVRDGRNRKLDSAQATAYAMPDLVGKQVVSNEGDQIFRLIDNIHHKGTGIKIAEDVDSYTMCMLANEPKAQELYSKTYAAQISYAAASFGVPPNLLACTCGRESRFDSTAKSETGASGICQATGGFVDEISRQLNMSRDLQKSLEDYVSQATPTCKRQFAAAKTLEESKTSYKLTKSLLDSCPGLGLASAAIYLKHISTRLEKNKTTQSPEEWQRSSLDAYAAVAGTYNIGATYASDVLSKVNSREEWGEVLVAKTCSGWMTKSTTESERQKKLLEVRSHMIAIRNCLQKDNYLNHQSKEMGGNCAGRTTREAIAEANDYAASLPKSCNGRAEATQIGTAQSGLD